jgi:fructose-bisphosphate aldolase class I
MDERQLEKIRGGRGFIAALDQSGGSTPAALAAYGIAKDSYSTDDEMFALMQEMRSRIARSPAFDGDHILGAILFEDSVKREVDGVAFTDYLWNSKRIVPFLKVDRGLEALSDGVQLMKAITDLDQLLALGLQKGGIWHQDALRDPPGRRHRNRCHSRPAVRSGPQDPCHRPHPHP